MEASCLEQAKSFLVKHNTHGTILFSMITGSKAYNVANESSDIDYLGVYLFNTREFLSFDSTLPKDSLATLPNQAEEIDNTLYEAKHFCQLLVKGNPFCIEAVFATRLCYMTQSWKDLQTIRHTLLNKRTVHQFLSYCANQKAKHDKKPLVGKRAYHIVRMLYEATNIVDGLEPCVWFPEGSRRSTLLSIRSGQIEGEALSELIRSLTENIKSKEPWDNLPEGPNEKLLSDWVVSLRLKQLHHNPL